MDGLTTSVPPRTAQHDEQSALADRAACLQARQVLRSTGYLALNGIECGVSAGILELSGTVGSYYLKQLAQTVVLQLSVVREVKNSIEVAVPAQQTHSFRASW